MRGRSLERFVNALTERGLRLYGVERMDDGSLTAWMDASSYRSLRPLLRELHLRSTVLERQGLPFALRPWRGRWMLALGGIFCVAALFFLSQRVWEIRVEGNVSIPTDRVIAIVSKQVAIGMPMDKVDLDALRMLIERSDPRVAWAGAQRNGTRLTVHIVEGDLEKMAEDQGHPTNIVATKDAMIDELTVYRGYAPVREGQQVKEGDVLISGAIPANVEMGERYVTASGEVWGRLFYEAGALVARESSVYTRTGKSEDVLTIKLGRQVVEMSGRFAHFEVEDVERAGIDSLYLPLDWIRETHYETAPKVTALDDEQMCEAAEEKSREEAIALVPKDAEILSQRTNTAMTEEGLRAVTVIETRERIGASVHFDPPAVAENAAGETAPSSTP